MAFYFKNIKKDVTMTEKMGNIIEKNMFLDFVKKKDSDELKEYCHLTGKYRGPAHQSCNINVTQKQSNSIPFVFHNFW